MSLIAEFVFDFCFSSVLLTILVFLAVGFWNEWHDQEIIMDIEERSWYEWDKFLEYVESTSGPLEYDHDEKELEVNLEPLWNYWKAGYDAGFGGSPDDTHED